MSKMAPVQGDKGFRVPWEVHVRAWQVYAALGHGAQSAQRVAERGGFGAMEMILLLAERHPWGGMRPLSPSQSVDLAEIRKLRLEAMGSEPAGSGGE